MTATTCTWCTWPSATPRIVENVPERLCERCSTVAEGSSLVAVRLP